jgi:DNA-binding transcriptional ArsR family regulator
VFDETEQYKLSKIFSAMGSVTRLRIIELISETKRPLHIKAVAKILKKDYAAVYRHIKVLEKSGLVGFYEVGRSQVIYLKNENTIKECVQIAKKRFENVNIT